MIFRDISERLTTGVKERFGLFPSGLCDSRLRNILITESDGYQMHSGRRVLAVIWKILDEDFKTERILLYNRLMRAGPEL